MKKVSANELKFRNITISGVICTGTSTLSKLLQEKLGWDHRDSGTIVREYTAENKLSLEKTNMHPDDFHRKVDAYYLKNLKEGKEQILEGWLAGFMAQDISGVLKVLLLCSDESIRIDRLVNRDNLTVEAAKNQIRTREGENVEKWSKLYEASDFWNPKYYDLVIDTYSHSKEETRDTVLRKLGYFDWLEKKAGMKK